MKRVKHISDAEKGFRMRLENAVSKKFGISPKNVETAGNSLLHPNTFAIGSRKYTKFSCQAIAIVHKDFDGNIVDTYGISVTDLMNVMRKVEKDGLKLMTNDQSAFDDAGTLVSFPFSYLNDYKITLE